MLTVQLKQLLVRARREELVNGRIAAQTFSKSEKEALIRLGYLRKAGTNLELTDAGRRKVKVVLTGGVFDLLHLGHVYTLEKARKLGDLLVVVVAHDSTVRRLKGRPPLHTARERAELLGKLRCVDVALVGDAKDRNAVLRRVKPDLVVFGYDQKADARLHAKIRKLKERLKGKAFKTSKIVEGI
ncbi:FAD synthase [Candidatus Burarchaeum australiense]|nr:FAD synthase [Candidatus Burarchaeum australiense]